MKKTIRLAGLFLLGLVPALASANVTVDDPNDEVQVGYGTLRRGELTSSIVSVDVKAMLKKNPTTVAKMIQGAAAGVDVIVPDGSPEETATVVIRGLGTATGDTAPLWVVDGVVVDDISFLNPRDVEAIDILKDAAALSIYYGNAVNGAILITTRNGRNCKTHVTASANVGVQTLASRYDVLDANGLAKVIRDTYEDNGIPVNLFKPEWSEAYDGGRNSVDWQKELTRTAVKHNYLVSAYGGNKKSTYNVSLGYNRNDGIMLGSGYSRFTAHAAAKSAVTNYLEIGANVDYAHSASDLGCRTALSELAAYTPSLDYIELSPDRLTDDHYQSVNTVNPDGSYGCGILGTRKYANPVAEALNNSTKAANDIAVARGYIDAIFFRNDHHSVDLKGVFGYQYKGISASSSTGGAEYSNYVLGDKVEKMWPGYSGSDFDNSYRFDTFNGAHHKLSANAYLTYRMTYPKHSLSVVIGSIFDNEHGQYSTAGAGVETPVHRHSGYFGRANYALFNRYVIGLSINRVGSSNFSKGNRWATAPSASLAWRVSEENFFQAAKPWFSDLKIRASWGTAINDGSETSGYLSGLRTVDGTYTFYRNYGVIIPASSLIEVQGDTNLKWETTESHDIGIDLGFFDNTLTASFDYYRKITKDLLGYVNGIPSVGMDPLYTNAGEISNSGFEFTLAYNREFGNGLGVHASFLGSTHNNKVSKYYSPAHFTPDAVEARYDWRNCSIVRAGDPVGAIYGYVAETDEESGSIYKDLNGDGVIDSKDMTVLGSALPKFTYALNIGLSYRNWDLTVYGYGAAGRDLLSYPALRLGHLCLDETTPNNILKNATACATVHSITETGEPLGTEASDLWVKKADYFRLSDIQLGYSFGDKVLKALKMSGMRLYLAVQNVALASPYKTCGDPETFNGNAALNSVDLGSYARPRTYMAGLNITF